MIIFNHFLVRKLFFYCIYFFKLYKFTFFQKIIQNLIILYWKSIAPGFRKNRNNSKKPKLYWGDVPILNNIYWSNAMQKVGYESDTVMATFYSLNEKSDFNIYHSDIIYAYKKKYPSALVETFYYYFLFDYIVKNYDILHMPCSGTPLQNTRHAQRQAELLALFNIKSIVIPYGSDYQQYSKIINLSLRHSLLISYPEAARNERNISNNIQYWTKNADVFFGGFQVDGIGRWDLLPFNMLTIDTDIWKPKQKLNQNDGIIGTVKIVHTPNHRGVKGTEFIIKAVDELKNEGLRIELILLEKVTNKRVREVFEKEADILIEQIIGGAYAMSAIEGMATSLAVITNLEFEDYTRVFRRYSYLNECPILSATPESIKDRIKTLVLNPELRNKLAKASRLYVEKYHSQRTAVYMFENIYKKIWNGYDIDLMSMFHPLKKDSYNNQTAIIKHGLEENKIPHHS